MKIRFSSYDAKFVNAMRHGGKDAYDMPPETTFSDGAGNPCRCCLDFVPEGEVMLILAACPFPEPQPYAETGPIFLCAGDCTPWSQEGVPPILRGQRDFLLKAYSSDNRIIYGTGKVVPADGLRLYAESLLADVKVGYVDVRSARNNCFQTRITRHHDDRI